MVLAIKNRASYYKRFEVDIWGVLKTNPISRPRLPILPIFVSEFEVFQTPSGESGTFNNFDLLRQFIMARIGGGKEYNIFSTRSGRFKLRECKRENIDSVQKAAPWVFLKSNKVERIRLFFFNIYQEKVDLRRKARSRYIYRIDIVRPRIFRKTLKARFVSIRLTKLFYLIFTYRQFRRLASYMRRKDGYYGYNFCLALEGRLVSAIYRSSFLPNMFQCIQVVKMGYVAVNKVFQKYLNYRVKLSQFISFELLTKRIIYFCLLKRLACRSIAFNPPRYMFVSYSFIFAYMKRPPCAKDLIFPVGVDMYRATGYAY